MVGHDFFRKSLLHRSLALITFDVLPQCPSSDVAPFIPEFLIILIAEIVSYMLGYAF